MGEERDIRGFFSCEIDELALHETEHGPPFVLVALRLIEAMLDHPEVEVVEVANFDREAGGRRIPVRWCTEAVGCDEERRFIRGATLFAVHRGLDGLRFMVRIGQGTTPGIFVADPAICVSTRWADRERMTELLDWIGKLEEEVHPLRGRAFELRPNRLTFLPEQRVAREDLVLPGAVLDEVERNLAFLDDPERWPEHLRHRAILLSGEPGVGKTLLARWLSARFDCTTLWVTPGALWNLGPSEVFNLARKLRPSLLILDDLDLAAGDRSGQQPLGDLLGQLDGFADLEEVAVLATTNHPEALDPALHPTRRPGRFHSLIAIDPPGDRHRRVLLERLVHGSEVVDEAGGVGEGTLERVVEASAGATGARLTEMVRDLEVRLLWRSRSGEAVSADEVLAEMLAERPTPGRAAFGFRHGGGAGREGADAAEGAGAGLVAVAGGSEV